MAEDQKGLDVNQAVKAALGYYAALYPKRDMNLVELEEVEVGDERDWLITVSYPEQTALAPLIKRAGQPVPKSYKTFRIDAETGEMKAMKMRLLG